MNKSRICAYPGAFEDIALLLGVDVIFQNYFFTEYDTLSMTNKMLEYKIMNCTV
jgi:hypothetical protein